MSEADKEKSQGGGQNIWLIVISVAVALIGAAAIYYYRGGFGGGEEEVVKGEPDPVELAKAGPLPDIVIGEASAPNTIIEYASMTCPHCAQFQHDVFPELKAKYLDTGRAKYTLREFPLDNLAVAAFMLARCAGEDRYYPMVDGLFETQEVWAVRGPEGKDKLEQIARQAGFSKERFDKCLGDKALFDDVVKTRSRGHQRFGVDSTPTFFINAKRMTGDHQLSDFDTAFAALGVDTSAPAGVPATSKEPSPAAGAEGSQPSAETPQPSAETPAPSAETPQPSAETPQPSTEAAEPTVDSSQPVPVVPPESEGPVPGSAADWSAQRSGETPEPSAETPEPSVATPEPSAETPEPSAETPEPSADASQPSPVVPPESEGPVPGSVGNP